ncbi:hypothetical protein PHAVU_007G007500 [Phaseolus vulgaris]|uniref:S-protein homolog n=1 Tax=Phaseolus vulgaris TaxID=3885 RepID=V7B9X3_PHAVU|nr:hypothetical protein PHAVU_007G007500g [Phaseolus vulgaris]ESW14672.1 hypothetical protein PHAVU_007G007500g [Phaseolus vulgaris]
MSISIRVFVLVLVAVCLNVKSSVSGDSLASTHQNVSNIFPEINIMAIIIMNDLPQSPTKLIFVADFQKNEVEISHKNAYTKLLNTEKHSGLLKWKECVTLSVIPGAEEGHQRIFWSAREDGLYHSWDNQNWNRRQPWDTC